MIFHKDQLIVGLASSEREPIFAGDDERISDPSGLYRATGMHRHLADQLCEDRFGKVVEVARCHDERAASADDTGSIVEVKKGLVLEDGEPINGDPASNCFVAREVRLFSAVV